MAIIKADSRKLPGTIMSLPTAYLVTTKNLDSFLNALKKELHYNIQIVLPETRDVAVFDAIFESLKKHLL